MIMRLRLAFCAVILAIAAGAANGKDGAKRPQWQGHGIKPPAANFPLPEIVSGYWFRTKETRAIQDDDFNNPGFFAVEQGEQLWSKPDGATAKSCASCHHDAAASMKGVGAAMPQWSETLHKPVNLEQQINICRADRMQAGPWKFGSAELTAMTAFVRFQSRGLPVSPRVDGPMTPWFDKGRQLYYQRNGQLDLACASCHEKNHGRNLRADFLSQGQSNGFPVYRLREQRLVPLHERMEGCIFDVRGVPYEPLSDEFVALELYLAWRGSGLPVETPAVRN
jgi:L-cysteine S-thiosulfotransferase